MEEYKKLLVASDNELYLDGVNLQIILDVPDKNISNFFNLLHYKLMFEQNDYCKIISETTYNGSEVEHIDVLYVMDSYFEQMRKEIYMFAKTSCHRCHKFDNYATFSDGYTALEYSEYLKSKNIYHNVIISNCPMIYFEDNTFDIKEIEENYHNITPKFSSVEETKQKVKTLKNGN